MGHENATVRDAYHQLQTYKHDIPSLFPYTELLVISDGIEARVGTLTSGWERFMPWRTIEGLGGSIRMPAAVFGEGLSAPLIDELAAASYQVGFFHQVINRH